MPEQFADIFEWHDWLLRSRAKASTQEDQKMGRKTLYEFVSLDQAEKRHVELERLGWRPFSIFRMSSGTWAFWVP